MKPIKLTISAFGPFAGEEVVDFTSFECDGLFLLCGETGAGKTTIFDAISYALFGRVSGDTRGEGNLRSDFAKPETETFVQLEFEHRGALYSIRRSPEYERTKKYGDGKTKAIATVEFKLPEREVTKTREANAEVESLLAVNYEQFKQIMMIAQGEFLALLTASSDERTAIMRRVFSTGVYDNMQKQLSEYASRVKRDYDTLKAEVERLESTFVTDVDMSADRLAVLAALRGEFAKEIERLTVQLEQVKQLNIALSALTVNRVKRAERDEMRITLEAELEALRADEPKRKALELAIAELEKALPKYTEFASKTSELNGKTLVLTANEATLDKITDKITSGKARLAELRTAINSLKTAETDALRATQEFETATTRAKKLGELKTAQNDWTKKNAAYAAAQDEYFTKKKLYDDGQAGRLAKNLADGEPCPVCGSTEHPSKAYASEDAPTQAEYEKYENIYKDTLAAVSASREKRDNLSTELGVAVETLADAVAVQTIAVEQATAVRIAANAANVKLNTARASEKETSAQLDGDVGTEKTLVAEIAELKTAVSVVTTVVENLKKDLKHESEATAKAEINTMKTELEKSKDALELKTREFNDACNEISALTALIDGGEMTVSEVAAKLGIEAVPQDENDYTMRKRELTEKSAVAERDEHTALNAKENNAHIEKELVECRATLEKSEKLYGDADLLARTANGNLSGKNKLKFEAYVQQVYFDMVLAEANKRFETMTDGRFSLTRQSADKLQGKAGLDIDVYDAWTSTTRPAKKLSGGQSFMAALALAIGMSDVAQAYSGGIQIDAMFIDEGFGSLDSESLESAITVIAGLADGNRLVGIISHVDALKERIPGKICIERDKTGSKITG